jgi:polyhydroxyalkanoate synthesis repressor PhaR
MPTIIKRYSNRKLYDTATSCYVTLDEIGSRIQQGEEMQVIDHDSGADQTTLILLQILFDQEKRIGGLLPEILLTRLVRAGDRQFTNLRGAVQAFLEPDNHVDTHIRKRLARLVELGWMHEEERQRLDSLLLSPDIKREAPTPSDNTQQISALQQHMQALEKELADLQKQRGGSA